MAELLKSLIGLYARLHRKEFEYPLQIEENMAHVTLKELMWTGYKMLLRHPIEYGERGAHLEEYFAGQNLHFTPPEDFTAQSSLVLSAGGDLLSSRDATPSSTRHIWDEAEDFLFDADLCCGNLETPVVPSHPATFLPEKMSTRLALNNSPDMFEVFHRGGHGVSVFSTANNHSLDMGEDGLRETLEFLKTKNCVHVGTAASEEEREDIPVVEKNGVRVAFLSYTYALNKHRLPKGREYLVNYVRLNKPEVDISMIARHIRRAREEKRADIVVACLHWSIEFESYPLRSVMETGHRILELGVDVILGNHAHGIQPMEKYAYTDPFTGRKKDGLIAYALGDFISCTEKDEENTPNARISTLLRLCLAKGTIDGHPAAAITDLKIRPMYFYTRMEDGACIDYRLLNLRKLLEELQSGRDRMGLGAKAAAEAVRLGSLAKKVLHWDITA